MILVCLEGAFAPVMTVGTVWLYIECWSTAGFAGHDWSLSSCLLCKLFKLNGITIIALNRTNVNGRQMYRLRRPI